MTKHNMLRSGFRRLKTAARAVRDERFIRPLARSQPFRTFVERDFEMVVIDCGDHQMAFDPKDQVIGATIGKTRAWFRRETELVFEALPVAGSVFVDVGANIGTQTIYALMFGGFEKAVCFEPSPRNAMILRANLAINNLSDRATVVEAAAGAEEGRLAMSLSETNGGGHSLAFNRGTSTIGVDVVTVEKTLASFGVSQERVGLACIDVEGFESEVLAGWPSLAGTPVMMECRPGPGGFPTAILPAYRRWTRLFGPELQWRAMAEFDPSIYTEEIDLVLA